MTSAKKDATEEKKFRFPDAVFDWCVRWLPELRDDYMGLMTKVYSRSDWKEKPRALRYAVKVKDELDTNEQRRTVLRNRAYVIGGELVSCAELVKNYKSSLRRDDRQRLRKVTDITDKVPLLITVQRDLPAPSPPQLDSRLYFVRRRGRKRVTPEQLVNMIVVEQQRCLHCQTGRATFACPGGCQWKYCNEEHCKQDQATHASLCKQGEAAVNMHVMEQLLDVCLGLEWPA